MWRFQARLATAQGRGRGRSCFITGKDSPELFSRRPINNPFSLWKTERKEREKFYFLIFYIPTASFRFFKPKLKICIILSLPEAYSLFSHDTGGCPQLSRRPSVNNTAKGFLTSSTEGWIQGEGKSGFKCRPILSIGTAVCPGVDLTPELPSYNLQGNNRGH